MSALPTAGSYAQHSYGNSGKVYAQALNTNVSRCKFLVVQVPNRSALRLANFALHALSVIPAQPALNVVERAALRIMEAHAYAVEGKPGEARESLAAASNIIHFGQFRVQRLEQELVNRIELALSRKPLS